jgi:hypothetical protein
MNLVLVFHQNLYEFSRIRSELTGHSIGFLSVVLFVSKERISLMQRVVKKTHFLGQNGGNRSPFSWLA